MGKSRDLASSVNAGSIPGSRLENDAITASKMAANSVDSSELANASVTPSKLSGGQSGSAPVFAARAWVLFDGTKDTNGTTSTANTNRQILASGNVTSVLRNGTGDYTITFTTAMADANYCAVKSAGVSSGYGYEIFDQVKTTTTLRLGSGRDTASAAFDGQMNVVVFR